jgi:hypothetical protein
MSKECFLNLRITHSLSLDKSKNISLHTQDMFTGGQKEHTTGHKDSCKEQELKRPGS